MTARRSALHGAYLRGVHDGLNGLPEEACPYQDKRKANGKLTWSRAFITAWQDGRLHAVKNREQALITVAYAGRARV